MGMLDTAERERQDVPVRVDATTRPYPSRVKKPVCGVLLNLRHVAPGSQATGPNQTGHSQTPCELPEGHAGPHEWEDAWL